MGPPYSRGQGLLFPLFDPRGNHQHHAPDRCAEGGHAHTGRGHLLKHFRRVRRVSCCRQEGEPGGDFPVPDVLKGQQSAATPKQTVEPFQLPGKGQSRLGMSALFCSQNFFRRRCQDGLRRRYKNTCHL